MFSIVTALKKYMSSSSNHVATETRSAPASPTHSADSTLPADVSSTNDGETSASPISPLHTNRAAADSLAAVRYSTLQPSNGMPGMK